MKRLPLQCKRSVASNSTSPYLKNLAERSIIATWARTIPPETARSHLLCVRSSPWRHWSLQASLNQIGCKTWHRMRMSKIDAFLTCSFMRRSCPPLNCTIKSAVTWYDAWATRVLHIISVISGSFQAKGCFCTRPSVGRSVLIQPEDRSMSKALIQPKDKGNFIFFPFGFSRLLLYSPRFIFRFGSSTLLILNLRDFLS